MKMSFQTHRRAHCVIYRSLQRDQQADIEVIFFTGPLQSSILGLVDRGLLAILCFFRVLKRMTQ